MILPNGIDSIESTWKLYAEMTYTPLGVTAETRPKMLKRFKDAYFAGAISLLGVVAATHRENMTAEDRDREVRKLATELVGYVAGGDQ